LIEIARASSGDTPVFFADAPPPFVGSLLHRVGRADETAPTGGVTHLVEHLALPITGRRALDFNGTVDNILTSFFASGDADLVLPFLASTAARLRSLPLERLETERNILLAEESTQGWNLTRLAFALRFGPRGHGLSGYDEYGLRTVGADDVAAWAETRFVTGNTAVWLTGPAEALELELAPGPRSEPPAPRQLDGLPWPCFYSEGPFGAVAFSLLARRSSAFSAALSVLEHRVQERIRYELGLSYSPEALFLPLTKDTVHVVMVVDTMAANTNRVVEETLAVVETLAADGPTDEELDDERRFAARRLASPTDAPGHLFYAAAQHLLGGEFQQPGELERARSSLTAAEIAGALREAFDSLLVIAPPDTRRPERLADYPLSSTSTLTGTVFRPPGLRLRRSGTPELVLGTDGVLLRPDPERHVTARFGDCAAVLRYPDGSRTILTDDGFFVAVDPSAWRKGAEIVRAIDAAVTAERVVRMEPELLDRVDSVEEVAQASLRKRGLVSEELELLPHRLEEGETPLAFLSTTMGWRAGLLAATDRRILFLARIIRETWVEWPYEDIKWVHVESKRWGTKLRLGVPEGSVEFGEIKPEDAERFAEVVRERLQG
jgi:predicted Zn-dependent peptidase